MTTKASNTNTTKYIDLENFHDKSLSEEKSLFRNIRTEILTCCEDVYSPPVNRDKTTDIEYHNEFLAVKDSLDFIQDYNDFMDNYFGPLNGKWIDAGQ